MLLRYLERAYVRQGLDNIRIAATIVKLSFRVTESAADGESTGQYSDGSYDELGVGKCLIRSFAGCVEIHIFLELVWLRGCCRLVNLTTCLDDSLVLFDVRWFVIATQRHHRFTSV